MTRCTAGFRRFIRGNLTLQIVVLLLTTSFAASRFEHPSVFDVFWHWGGIAVAVGFHRFDLFEVWEEEVGAFTHPPQRVSDLSR